MGDSRVVLAMPEKPIVFISYSHKDEPETPGPGEEKWLSFVTNYLGPAKKAGKLDWWADPLIEGGEDWEPAIDSKLRVCAVFVLLVSPNSMQSEYVIDKEIALIRARQARGEHVRFYPIMLTPTPQAGVEIVREKNLRPHDGKPLSSFAKDHARLQAMTDIADEIAMIAEGIGGGQGIAPGHAPLIDYVRLPETPYVHLRGRETELARLDAAWADPSINIVSAVAEGGAGKSALLNAWLVRQQAQNYGGAEAVLGWSFYNQGTKERATSADNFLDWALNRLGLTARANSADAKGEAIAAALAKKRILLALDGVEPLQHGPGGDFGKLKDPGLRILLRRFAATAPGAGHGLIVLTSRCAVADLGKWRDSAAPVIELDQLSKEAGAELLKDNRVRGSDAELKKAAAEFGGHALALSLLAGFLKETQNGDVRRRDHIRGLLEDGGNPRHDHAVRVMESYAREWLDQDAVLHAIMNLIGLFDRPAAAGCLLALRRKPKIKGLTDALMNLSEADWRRAVHRLREAKLLLPEDAAQPDALNAHPLVREWFGERLYQANKAAWKTAHGRIYEFLRDSTHEGKTPALKDLTPLYQAIAHGCRAGRHQEALYEIYVDRLCRRDSDGEPEFYDVKKLGAFGSNLAALAWFFAPPYQTPVAAISPSDQAWVLNQAAFSLQAQGWLAEALPGMRAGLRMDEKAENWRNAAISSSNISETELILGDVAAAIETAAQAVAYAGRSGDAFEMMVNRTTSADALHAAGQIEEAERLFTDAERRQREWQPQFPLLSSVRGYQYCDLLLAKGDWAGARDRATQTLEWCKQENWLLDIALDTLTLGRAHLGLALDSKQNAGEDAAAAGMRLGEAVEGLRAAGTSHYLPRGLLARAAYRRAIGDWAGAAGDLAEVEEIAEPGPMRLHQCDLALERARLALAKSEAFAPLGAAPAKTGAEEINPAEQLTKATELIAACGYHRRDQELAELQGVLRGERTFAALPPRV